MTTPPAGEHHTGTLNLTGQGNPYEAQDRAAAAIVGALADRGITMAPDGRHIHHVALACVDAAYPAIRQHVAEQIAAKANQIGQEFQDTAIIHRDLSIEHGRSTIKGTSHMNTSHAYRNKADGAWAVAHAAREIGGGQ